MNRALGILVIIGALILATILGAILQPYTNFFADKAVDKDYPFNFKNEYELLIWQNEQKETKDVLISTLSQTNLKVDNEDEFAQCVIEKNLTSLRNLNSQNSKLNPINPTTVAELGKAIAKFQPLLIEIQTKSVKSCLPEEQVDNRTEITLACNCTSIEHSPQHQGHTCTDGLFDSPIGVSVDFKKKRLTYGGIPYSLYEDDEFYYGVSFLTKFTMESKFNESQKSYTQEDPENLKRFLIGSPDIKLERLTGRLEENMYGLWRHTSDGYFWELSGSYFHSAITGKYQCRLAERF